MMLSQADGYTKKMLWGQPPPETVRDYMVEVCRDGRWWKAAEITGNYQRRNRIGLDGQPIGAVRITGEMDGVAGSSNSRIGALSAAIVRQQTSFALVRGSPNAGAINYETSPLLRLPPIL